MDGVRAAKIPVGMPVEPMSYRVVCAMVPTLLEAKRVLTILTEVSEKRQQYFIDHLASFFVYRDVDKNLLRAANEQAILEKFLSECSQALRSIPASARPYVERDIVEVRAALSRLGDILRKTPSFLHQTQNPACPEFTSTR